MCSGRILTPPPRAHKNSTTLAWIVASQLIDVPLTKTNSIPHPSGGRAVGAKVIMRPAAPGTGVIAGGAVRTVLELAGVKNVLAKQLGSNNPLNNARAAINSLDSLRTFSEVAQERDIPLEQIYA